MKARRKNGWFDNILHAGSRTTYHGKIRGRSSGKPRVAVYRGKQRSYKGVQIIPVEGGEYTISIDRDSRFENVRDAKKVIDHMKRNPGGPYTVKVGSNYEEVPTLAQARERARVLADTYGYIGFVYKGSRLVDSFRPKRGNPRKRSVERMLTERFGSPTKKPKIVSDAEDIAELATQQARRFRANPTIRVRPSGRYAGRWEVGVPGYPVQTKKSKRGAMSLARAIQKQEGGEIIELDAPAETRPAPKWMQNPRGSKGKFQRCVESVASRGSAYDPRAVCGAMEKRMRGNPDARELQKELRELRAEMKRLGVRKISPFNGGLSGDEVYFNQRRFALESQIKQATRANPAAGAIAVSEEFHGRKVKQMVPVQSQRHYHKYLADLGELRKLVVVTRDGKGKVTLTGFQGAMLTCNEAKDQLFITGGDQSVNVRDFGIEKPHEVETLGEVVTIEYFTDKHHLGDEGGTATYTHKFRSTNENGKHVTVRTARNPDLIYHKRDKHLEFSGGSYLIRKEGIDL